MRLKTLGRVIATRRLSKIHNGGEVVVLIGEPKEYPGGGDYYCPYQITGLEDAAIRHAGGIDSIQALELALRMIGVDLYTSDDAQRGNIRWLGATSERDLGFPLPRSISDIGPE